MCVWGCLCIFLSGQRFRFSPLMQGRGSKSASAIVTGLCYSDCLHVREWERERESYFASTSAINNDVITLCSLKTGEHSPALYMVCKWFRELNDFFNSSVFCQVNQDISLEISGQPALTWQVFKKKNFIIYFIHLIKKLYFHHCF